MESTCRRLTPLLYIFFRSSERRPLARPEHRGQSSRLLLRQVVRVFHSQGPGPCIWCIIPVSFWGHVFHYVFHTLRCTYVSPVLFDPCDGTTLEVYCSVVSRVCYDYQTCIILEDSFIWWWSISRLISFSLSPWWFIHFIPLLIISVELYSHLFDLSPLGQLD